MIMTITTTVIFIQTAPKRCAGVYNIYQRSIKNIIMSGKNQSLQSVFKYMQENKFAVDCFDDAGQSQKLTTRDLLIKQLVRPRKRVFSGFEHSARSRGNPI